MSESRQNDVKVGKEVSAVIDGEFEGGFWLSIRDDNSNVTYRGQIFKSKPQVSVPSNPRNAVLSSSTKSETKPSHALPLECETVLHHLSSDAVVDETVTTITKHPFMAFKFENVVNEAINKVRVRSEFATVHDEEYKQCSKRAK
ncbi:hypothetical protein RJT34_10918 [Clitoria ternatea]|uniref:Uncharacterized protein n=1 Tax=Clitoria ternatea TaxID=43366 RepID=A0AAN9JKX7_CLITE